MIIKFSSTDKQLSAFAGLSFFTDILKHSNFEGKIKDCLPKQIRGSQKNFLKFKQILLALDAGADCLSDIDTMNNDPGFVAVCGGKVYSSKSCGDFLREFSAIQNKTLATKLIDYAYDMRLAAGGSKQSITFDIDSTSNQQYGLKMEGVEKNYKGTRCLDTIQVYDELGIQYWSDVRSGATHTADGAIEIIHQLYSKMPQYIRSATKYLRADRGYCSLDIFDACMAKGVKFVIGLRSLMLQPLVGRINHWHKQDVDDENRIIFRDNRECEVGETVYTPKNVKRKDKGAIVQVYRVVVIRAPKLAILEQQKNAGDAVFPLNEGDYDYFGWCTSIGSSEMRAEDVIKFYRGRGAAELYIKDIKNGFDQHHYPCMKLQANRAFSLITAFAYNIMRLIAITTAIKNKIHFTKSIRLKFVNIPAQVVAHAREFTFKFNHNVTKEVFYWREKFKNLQWRFEISTFT